ncbi:MAG: hypothetical protein CMI09_12000 [Oceanospirillaceae bacterium]|nr:hypothetical protein [Oceanospirillaceae bacterium]
MFIAAATLDFIAALLHVACILGGPAWYRFFGAGEELATMAEQGSWWPGILTALIAAVLAVWGLYFLSLGNQLGGLALPWVEGIAISIAAVYALRGLYPLLLSPWVAFFRSPFMLVTSGICVGFAVVHVLALRLAGVI